MRRAGSCPRKNDRLDGLLITLWRVRRLIWYVTLTLCPTPAQYRTNELDMMICLGHVFNVACYLKV